MKLSDDDLTAVADVAFACGLHGTSVPEWGLDWVHIEGGWAWATDAARIDARAIDHPGTGRINPYDATGLIHATHPDRHLPALADVLDRYRLRGPTGTVVIAEPPTVTPDPYPRVCLGCGRTGSQHDHDWSCCPDHPLVDSRRIGDLIEHADDTPLVLAYDIDAGPLWLDEGGEHLHLLMRCLRPPGSEH